MRTKQKKQYTIIDLFAGAGGLSEGFIQAGFYPIAHVEMDKDACSTLKTRCCYHYLYTHGQLSVYHQYLKGEISRETLYGNVPTDIINSVINAEIRSQSVFVSSREIISLYVCIDARGSPTSTVGIPSLAS